MGVSLVLMAGMAQGEITRNLPVVRALAWGTLIYASWDLGRFLVPQIRFTPNLWLYEHIVKIIGAYFAAVAAFSGSVLTLFPEPWRQLWATNLGAALAIAMVVRYRKRLQRKAVTV